VAAELRILKRKKRNCY